MSYDRPDSRAFVELELLVRSATEELAAWRRRCLRAETELQELRARGGPSAGPDLVTARTRVAELEAENLALKERVAGVRERVQALATRVAFLERGLEEAS
jgi:chromosome segregation ATPase